MKEYSLGTKCVQGGYTPGNGEPRQIPIIQSTTFKYETSEAMGRLFDLEEEGYFYSRLQNPTNDTVARKICELEAEVRQCLLLPVRQHPFMRCLTLLRAETTLYPHLLFMVEHIIFLQ